MHTHLSRMTAVLLTLLSGCGTAGLPKFFAKNEFDSQRFEKNPSALQPQTHNDLASNSRGNGRDSDITQARHEAPDGKLTKKEKEARELADTLQQAQLAGNAGQMRQARLLYESVLKRKPGHAGANHRLAIISDQEGRFKDSEQYYKAAREQNDRDPNLMSDMGYSYLLQDKFTEAEIALTRALELQPSLQIARNNLGYVYAKRAMLSGDPLDYQRAAEQFRQTGTEQQTQQILQQLFPQGPPGANLAQQMPEGGLPPGVNGAAAPNPFGGQPASGAYPADPREHALNLPPGPGQPGPGPVAFNNGAGAFVQNDTGNSARPVGLDRMRDEISRIEQEPNATSLGYRGAPANPAAIGHPAAQPPQGNPDGRPMEFNGQGTPQNTAGVQNAGGFEPIHNQSWPAAGQIPGPDPWSSQATAATAGPQDWSQQATRPGSNIDPYGGGPTSAVYDTRSGTGAASPNEINDAMRTAAQMGLQAGPGSLPLMMESNGSVPGRTGPGGGAVPSQYQGSPADGYRTGPDLRAPASGPALNGPMSTGIYRGGSGNPQADRQFENPAAAGSYSTQAAGNYPAGSYPAGVQNSGIVHAHGEVNAAGGSDPYTRGGAGDAGRYGFDAPRRGGDYNPAPQPPSQFQPQSQSQQAYENQLREVQRNNGLNLGTGPYGTALPARLPADSAPTQFPANTFSSGRP